MRDRGLGQLVHQLGQALRRVRAYNPLDRLQQVRPFGPDQGDQQRRLAGKVLVQRPDRNSGLRGDGIGRQRIEAWTAAKVGCSSKDPVDFGAGAALAGLFAKFDHHAEGLGQQIVAENC